MIEEDPFRIRAHVRDFELISDGYRRASDDARMRWRSTTDIAYGASQPERLDLFFPRNGSRWPIHLFVHGGYWRANVKEDYAFVANTVCAAGGIAAILEYGRLPMLRMSELVAQVRRAAAWLLTNAHLFGGDPTRLSASGHSAGAHLAFYLAAPGALETSSPSARPRSLLLISGIYDLTPIRSSFLQSEINLSTDEVFAWSPVLATPDPETRLTLTVGARETMPFIAQMNMLTAKLRSSQNPIRSELIADRDHMTILEDIQNDEAQIAALLRQCLD